MHQIRPMGAGALLQDATMGQVSHLLYSLTTPASVLSHLQPATPAGKASGRPGKKIRTTIKDTIFSYVARFSGKEKSHILLLTQHACGPICTLSCW